MEQSDKNIYHRNRILGGVILLLALIMAALIFLLVKNRSSSSSSWHPVPMDPNMVNTVGSIADDKADQYVPIKLSEGQPVPQFVQPVPVATGEPLSEAEIEQILARLPALVSEPTDQRDFRLPQDPIPPPRTGEIIAEPFPPAGNSAQPTPQDSGPLEVLRFGPEGEIPLAPFVNITFNQPMVALSTLSELGSESVPVQVEPALPGTWRWLGAKTLTFEYDSALIDRLPMATAYRVTIPVGTKSAIGGELAESVTWTFSTPPLKMTTGYPTGTSQPLEPVFFIAFDQRIEPASVLENVRVHAGSHSVGLKLVEEAAILADKSVSSLVKNTPEGRWLAFQAQEPLPTDTTVTVDIGPGTPSAEGPLVTQTSQSFSFSTYAPLRVEEHGCSWSRDTCVPMSPFYIRFNNSINVDLYSESMLRIQPELPGASINIIGNTISIQGATSGQTIYRVVLAGDIEDIFGQQLGKETSLTFKVGPAEPLLFGPDQTFITIDPAASQPAFSVYAINYSKLDVKIYSVQPSDWPDYRKYLREYQDSNAKAQLPGRLVLDKAIGVEAQADTLSEVRIELDDYMDGDFGHFIVVVAPPTTFLQNNQSRYWQTVHAWVQVTQIGLDAFVDHSEMVVWTTALKDGTPLAGINIQAEPSRGEITTGENGTVRFPIPNGASYLVGSRGADQALLPRSIYPWDDGSWSVQSVSDNLRWFVFDDRHMYRPGEEMHLKGWLRRVGGKQDGDIGLVGSQISAVSYQVIDSQGNEIINGRAEINALGGFDFVLNVPEAVNLGYAQIYLAAQGDLGGLNNHQYYHSFQIQEFRRPEFEVTARNETPGPYFAGEQAIVAVSAAYYAGGPLPNAEVSWLVTTSPGSYAPPNWDDFTFGTWHPWWSYYIDYEEGIYGPGGGGGGRSETFSGQTDASGTNYLRLDFGQEAEPQPQSVIAEATVFDVNRQAWSRATTLLVHPADLYVGLRSERYFVERGNPLKIELIVTDLDGNPVVDRPIGVQAARLEWKYQAGTWIEQEADVQVCNLGSALEPVSCIFETPVGGTYQITAVIQDELGRKNQSRFTRWVSGGQQPPARKVEQETLTMIPDQETYRPGESAQILVQSPFSPAEGLLTVSRSGFLYTKRFQIEQGTATLTVPILEEHIPNLNIQVDVVGKAVRTDDQGEALLGAPPRPAFATGQLTLSIPPLQRTLSVRVIPGMKELEPGGQTSIAVAVKDAAGQPVSGAELALVVVDEAILALSNYQLVDPMGVFYQNRPADTMSYYSRSSIVLLDPQALAGEVADQSLEKNVMAESGAMSLEAPMAMPSMAMSDEAEASAANTPIKVRSDFNPLAIFAPTVRTGPDGEAQVAVQLPDNLTRYRVMAVAVDEGRRFGSGESNLVARLPLMVRPSPPRFLNFGDRFELPVVLQNQTGTDLSVAIAIQASNIELTGSIGLQVTVPAHDRVEVRFPAAAQKAGTARFQIAAISGDYADAADFDIPVYTPATTEAFATYGVVDMGAVVQPVAAPGDVFPQYGGLEIQTSSTALQALTDAILYLASYPYECSEQLASRILAVAAMRDVLTAFEADGLPAPAELESAVQRDIERLQGLQNFDGGFPYWRRGYDSIPFNTIHVAHALARAKAKGFTVPVDMEQNLLSYLVKIESFYPNWYGERTRQTLSAYALYVRQLMGDQDAQKALGLIDKAGLENLDLDAVGWLWQVLQDAPEAGSQLESIRRLVNNRVVETASTANFITSFDDQTYLLLSSDRRTDAILLDAMIFDNPQADLIPKLVNGLLAHRTRGRWGNTQENVFVLLSLDRYFNTFEFETPDFVARIWLGDAYAGGYEFRGRTTERQETLIPMAYLVDESLGGGQMRDLTLSKDGPGRLYYRLGLRYAPIDLEMPPLDMGFVIQRSYEAVDDPADVNRDEDGVWQIRAGARVRVRVSMVADSRRYHVALVDPLPAGFEIVNPSLAVSGSTPQDPSSQDSSYGWWWWGTWYEHQNLRDERAEAFTPLLWDGVYEYTYIARATTPGRFVVPPAKAEEMYSPEVFGRSASDVVIVR